MYLSLCNGFKSLCQRGRTGFGIRLDNSYDFTVCRVSSPWTLDFQGNSAPLYVSREDIHLLSGEKPSVHAACSVASLTPEEAEISREAKLQPAAAISFCNLLDFQIFGRVIEELGGAGCVCGHFKF